MAWNNSNNQIIFRCGLAVPMDSHSKTVFGNRIVCMNNIPGNNLWLSVITMACSGNLSGKSFCVVHGHVSLRDTFLAVRDMIENMKQMNNIRDLRIAFKEYLAMKMPETLKLMNGESIEINDLAVRKELSGTDIKFVKYDDIKRVLCYVDPFYW